MHRTNFLSITKMDEYVVVDDPNAISQSHPGGQKVIATITPQQGGGDSGGRGLPPNSMPIPAKRSKGDSSPKNSSSMGGGNSTSPPPYPLLPPANEDDSIYQSPKPAVRRTQTSETTGTNDIPPVELYPSRPPPTTSPHMEASREGMSGGDNSAAPIQTQPTTAGHGSGGGYGGGIGGGGGNTMVVMQGPPAFGREAAMLQCPKCRAQISTNTAVEPGSCTWLACIGLCVIGW